MTKIIEKWFYRILDSDFFLVCKENSVELHLLDVNYDYTIETVALFEVESFSGDVSDEEAVCELWLKWQNLFEMKPDNIYSKHFVEMISKFYLIGVNHGKKEQMKRLIKHLEYRLEIEDKPFSRSHIYTESDPSF